MPLGENHRICKYEPLLSGMLNASDPIYLFMKSFRLPVHQDVKKESGKAEDKPRNNEPRNIPLTIQAQTNCF